MKRSLDACRSHPILVAAILGGVFGLANVVWIEVGGAAHKTSAGVVPLLWSSSTSHASPMNPVQTSTLLLIEVAGNVLAFTLLFTAPNCFAGRNSPHRIWEQTGKRPPGGSGQLPEEPMNRVVSAFELM